MFFFIGGVQPKTVDLDERPRPCPSCGLPRARLKRIDHYVSLFFIPVVRIKKGPAFLECDRCGVVSSQPEAAGRARPGHESAKTCPRCGRPLDEDFRYCPACGQRIRA